MKRSTKMLMMNGKGNRGRNDAEMNFPYNRYDRVENRRVSVDYEDFPRREWPMEPHNNAYGNMGGSEGDYTRDARNDYRGTQSRFTDDRGRKHYDNGRFAPENNMNSSYAPFGPYGEGNMEMDHDRKNMIGFERDNEPAYHMDENSSGNVVDFSGEANASKHPKFTPEVAKKWVDGMENEDGTKGAHWNLEQVKQIMAQRGINEDPYTFWAVLNSVYSDDVKIAKKFNVNNIDYYVDRACAWLKDKDAVKDKAAAYFEYVVKHGG